MKGMPFVITSCDPSTGFKYCIESLQGNWIMWVTAEGKATIFPDKENCDPETSISL